MSLDSTQRLEKINEAMGNLFERSRAAAREAARTGRTETVTGRDGKQYKLGSDVTRAQPGSALYPERQRMEREAAGANQGGLASIPPLPSAPPRTTAPARPAAPAAARPAAPAAAKPAAPAMPPPGTVAYGTQDQRPENQRGYVGYGTQNQNPAASSSTFASPTSSAAAKSNFVEITPEEKERVAGENAKRGMTDADRKAQGFDTFDDIKAPAKPATPAPASTTRTASQTASNTGSRGTGMFSPSTLGSGVATTIGLMNTAKSAMDTARGAASDIGSAARSAGIQAGVAGFNAAQGMVRGVESAARTAGEAAKTVAMNLPPVQAARAGYEGAKLAVQGAQTAGRLVGQGARAAVNAGAQAVNTAGRMASDVATGVARGVQSASDTATNAILGTSEQKPSAANVAQAERNRQAQRSIQYEPPPETQQYTSTTVSQSSSSPAANSVPKYPGTNRQRQGGSAPGAQTAVPMESYVLPQSRKLLENGMTTTITSSKWKGSLEEATRSVTKDILREVNNIRNR